jgi:mannose/fructose/N-acetylgalactosamine-specific phosphotransferase system component IID
MVNKQKIKDGIILFGMIVIGSATATVLTVHVPIWYAKLKLGTKTTTTTTPATPPPATT